MSTTTLINNPGLQDDESLISSFVVRGSSLNLILQIVNDNTGASNQHILVIGPRGSGKTTLVRRVAAEIRTSPNLSANWYPLVFPEEAYEVLSPGELWLEALFHLAEQTQEDRWLKSYQELKTESDEVRLRERALAQLMNFADTYKKRILLIVENLNMLVGEQLAEHHDWELRHTLQNEPRIMMLGTATSHFEGIKNISKAWFELFSTHELQPLGLEECRRLWGSISINGVSEMRVRPLMILTGGNPRLLRILADFSAKKSFKELMENLITLIDSHTEYFKSQLDALPSHERKIFVALLDIWDPASAKQVAAAARMGVNQASTMLQRLLNRGMVLTDKPSPRKKLYQVSERLFNIYYLMRRRSRPSDRVRAAVNFMVNFYEEDELVKSMASLAEEACLLDQNSRQDHFLAYKQILDSRPPELKLKIIQATPERFFSTPDLPEDVRGLARGPMAAPSPSQESLVNTADLSGDARGEVKVTGSLGIQLHKAASVDDIKTLDLSALSHKYEEALKSNEDSPEVWAELAHIFVTSFAKFDEAEIAYRKAIELSPYSPKYWNQLAQLYVTSNRLDKAEQTYLTILELEPNYANSWIELGRIYQQIKQYDQAECAFRKAVEIEPGNPLFLAYLGKLIATYTQRIDEAEQIYRKALEIAPRYDWAWKQLGALLLTRTNRYEAAEHALQRAVDINPSDVWAWITLGRVLKQLQRLEEAKHVWLKAIELDPSESWPWLHLGGLYVFWNQFDKAEHAFRKAVDVEPTYAWAWSRLATFLESRGTGGDETEKILLKAIELDPKESWYWNQLGTINESQNKVDRAEEAYRKALELDPTDSYLIFNLGRFVMVRQRSKEAEQLFLKALEMDPSATHIWKYLVRTRLAENGNKDVAYRQIYTDLERNGKNTEAFLAILDALPEPGEFENWVRTNVISRADVTWDAKYIWAMLLCRQSDWESVLEPLRELVDGLSDEGISRITDLLITVAAHGYAQDVLTITTDSKTADKIEPLIVGLRLFMQEQPTVAQEILEIGQDVARRIKQKQA